MGWKKGEGLGKSGGGMKDPVSLLHCTDCTGITLKVALSHWMFSALNTVSMDLNILCVEDFYLILFIHI